MSAKKPTSPTVLADTTVGDITALVDDIVIGGAVILRAGHLATTMWHADGVTFVRYALAGWWSSPISVPAATKIRLVSTVAQRLGREAAVDAKPVADPLSRGQADGEGLL